MSYIDVNGKYSAIKFLPSGDAELVFVIPAKQRNSLMAGIDEIVQAGTPELAIKADKRRRKRSLDANDYLWVLCTKIAEKLQDGRTMVTKEEVYRKHIAAAGKFTALAVQEVALESFLKAWSRNGIGYFAQVVDSTLDGCKKVFAYHGSSEYDTKQMSRLIDSVIEDARALDIETMPPKELESLMNEWGRKNERKS